jgi:LysM repeat protein
LQRRFSVFWPLSEAHGGFEREARASVEGDDTDRLRQHAYHVVRCATSGSRGDPPHLDPRAVGDRPQPRQRCEREASRSSISSSGCAPRIDCVRIIRASAPSASPTGPVRVISRIRAAMPSAVVSRHGTGIGAKPFGGRSQIDPTADLYALTRADDQDRAGRAAQRGLDLEPRPVDRAVARTHGSHGASPCHRKNGARRSLFCALAAVLVMGAACAEVQAASKPGSKPGGPTRCKAPERPAYHSVRPGETLSEIANRYGVDVRRLASANNLRVTDRVPVGRRLEIPITRIVHRVAPGRRSMRSPTATGARFYNRLSESNGNFTSGRGRAAAGDPAPPPDTRPGCGVSAAQCGLCWPARRGRCGAETPRTGHAARRHGDPGPHRARPILVDRGVADYRAARFERAIERTREVEHELLDLRNRSDARSIRARGVRRGQRTGRAR